MPISSDLWKNLLWGTQVKKRDTNVFNRQLTTFSNHLTITNFISHEDFNALRNISISIVGHTILYSTIYKYLPTSFSYRYQGHHVVLFKLSHIKQITNINLFINKKKKFYKSIFISHLFCTLFSRHKNDK